MGALSVVALVFAGLVGYSAGTALGARRATLGAAPWDLPLLLVVWSAALPIRGAVGRWGGVGLTLALGCLLGFAVARIRRRSPAGRAGNATGDVTGALRLSTESEPEPAGAWRQFALRWGNFQGRLLMVLFYYVILTPFAVAARLGTRQSPPGPSRWRPTSAPDPSLERARRQA